MKIWLIVPGSGDRDGYVELRSIAMQIAQTAKALDPKFQPGAAAMNLPTRFPADEDSRWPDYAIHSL